MYLLKLSHDQRENENADDHAKNTDQKLKATFREKIAIANGRQHRQCEIKANN